MIRGKVDRLDGFEGGGGGCSLVDRLDRRRGGGSILRDEACGPVSLNYLSERIINQVG